jgi:hypothetical protein
MRKDILAKAIRLADKSPARPEKVVVASPKTMPEKMSERLYTRITPTEAKRLKRIHGEMTPISELLRELLLDYLDRNEHDKGRKAR